MTKNLEFILNEWKDIRSNTKELLKKLNIEELTTSLPRPELNTFMKHFEELIDVQSCYINAIRTKNMSFESMDECYLGTSSVEEILNKMDELDKELETVVSESKFNIEIDWFDDYKTVSSHLCALISHESFHLGQIIAFCYICKIQIPDQIVEDWALPQVEKGE